MRVSAPVSVDGGLGGWLARWVGEGVRGWAGGWVH